MSAKLSRYATKARQGLVPSRYGTLSAIQDPLPDEVAAQYQSEAERRYWSRRSIAPLVRIQRHQWIVNGERHLIPLTAEQLRFTR